MTATAASPTTTTRGVILARGLGTRMRKADDSADIDPAQAAVADTGMKGMIPIGRPFLDYLVSAYADAGFTDVCLIIGPEHDVVRRHYAAERCSRVRVHFAVQESPLGTADAVLAVESFAAGEPFVVINSDNYYGVAPLAALHRRRTPATIGFERDALAELGNISPDKLARFGAMEVDDTGALRRVVARPGEAAARTAGPIYASMNCWLFDSAIFEACRTVPISARGELELPQAVQRAIDGGLRIDVIPMRAPVLDMSSRGDIATVEARLRGVEVRL